jgi:FkbM family methyltransferase
MKDRIANQLWRAGIQTFRLSRRLNISASLEPILVQLGKLIPASDQPQTAKLSDGSTLVMPPGYRDTRTVVVGLFQEAETKLFSQMLHPGSTFVDVGAYVGYFTILASRMVGSAGHVYAFEPDPLAFSYLEKNIEFNDCSNATPVNKAVADTVATAALIRDPKGPETFVTYGPSPAQAMLVETITLDALFESQRWPAIDVIKMNIEGSELQALRGMTETSQRNPELKLVMEFNPSAMSRGDVSHQALTDALANLGFRRARIVERNLIPITGSELLPAAGAVYNILLTRD